jgi:hypothetical protein
MTRFVRAGEKCFLYQLRDCGGLIEPEINAVFLSWIKQHDYNSHLSALRNTVHGGKPDRAVPKVRSGENP